MKRRRSLVGVAVTLISCAILGIVGLRVEDRLEPLSLQIGGTHASEAERLAAEHFGPSSPFVVLLQGPPRELEAQGPRVVRALRGEPAATVISPWDKGPLPALRPARRKAIVLVDFHLPLKQAMRKTVPALEKTLAGSTDPPVSATQSGFASVSRALQEETLDATQRAELLAAPLLILVLLLVLRSVVAASIPLAFGALTVVAGRGVLSLLSSAMTIDALSLVVCTMMGLALGVDYTLLIVSRFREELKAGRPSWAAAMATKRTAGRTTFFAGLTLVIAIACSAFLQPGSLLLSLATATAVVTTISVFLSNFAVVPLLGLLGPRIDIGSIPTRARLSPSGSTVAAVAARMLRKPATAALLAALPLLVLALPSVAFTSGAPGVEELSSSNPARRSAERIDRAVGAGWEAPFILLAATERGPVTSRSNMRLLSIWQRRIVRMQGVRSVIGPAPIARRSGPLQHLGSELTAGDFHFAEEAAVLGPRLRKAADAVLRLRSGLASGAAGSGLIAQGSARAAAGAGIIASELRRAAANGDHATAAIGRLEHGARLLSRGQREASVGGLTLTLGLRSLLPRVRHGELARSRRLARRLEREAATDPTLAPAAGQARALARVIAANRNEIRQLREVAQELNRVLNRLAPGGRRLEAGVARLSEAAGGLSNGLARLGGGADRLAGGLVELEGAAGALQRGLAGGFHRARPLQVGLRRAGVRAAALIAPAIEGVRQLQRNSPHFFDSGYFVLSAIDGAGGDARSRGAEAISIDRGGQAARMLIVSTHPFNSAGLRAVDGSLRKAAGQIESQTGLQTGVAGGAATLITYGEATEARLPWVIAAFVVFTLVALIAILRAPVLALLAVSLNLLSVAAAIGVMTLVCQLPAGWPLGGHPYVDTVGAGAIFGVTFGLSIDYAVFLILRMRERYEVGGDSRAAIGFGLEKTAGVITGAAAIMATVFGAFATAPIATVSQMGIGLTVAILLDATVVRIVLLPALMLLLGDRAWWVPDTLARILPRRSLLTQGAGPNEA